MSPSNRRSLIRAMTLPMSLLLFWQALGWIAFGFLEPIISQRVGEPTNPGFILTVGLLMAAVTATLGLSALYYWSSTSQGDIVPRRETHHKCLNCGHTITMGTISCPYCGSKTLF